jgi:formylglycine-generating enzyme required for sulfatase activity/serine/threonine protein kinase
MQQAGRFDDPLGLCGAKVADKYLVERLVGEGGYAVVYRAQHVIWREPVAMKFFRALGNLPEDVRQGLLDDFVQEGKLMSRLSSKTSGVVQARDVGALNLPDGSWIPYMVLEWMDGRSLDAVLVEETSRGQAARDLPTSIKLLEPAAAAVEIAHREGIVHRDLKPENLFVVGDPNVPRPLVKVLDFGIAKVMSGDRAQALAATGTAPTPFTSHYGAPEQFSRSHGATGPWTDVYSMALVLLEVMRGGHRVYPGDDYVDHARAARDPQRRPTPRALGFQVSDQVEQVFASALSVTPSERWASMGAFWSALHRALNPAAPAWTAVAMPGQTGPSRSGATPQATSIMPGSGGPGGGGSAGGGFGGPGMGGQQASSTPGAVATGPRASGGAGKTLLIVAGVVALFGVGVGATLFGKQWLDARTAVAVPSASTPAVGSGAPDASAATSAAAAPATTCPDGAALVVGGSFFMGSDEATFKLWQPAHRVSVDAYCIQKTEVTVEAYTKCVDAGACKRPDAVPDYPPSEGTPVEEHKEREKKLAELCNFGRAERMKHPINCVSNADAEAYCGSVGMRLPTEAEWEFAARGSDGRKFPWGDDPASFGRMNACGAECNAWETKQGLPLSGKMYDEDDGFLGTAPVGSFPQGDTKLGLSDMVGNVWEWTSDWFAVYSAEEQLNPKGAPVGERKAIRGGGYNGGVNLWLNPAFRYHQLATARAPGIGFRCAKSLK